MMKKKRTDRHGVLHLSGFSLRSSVQFATPTRITNASSAERYMPPAWHVREGGEDHKRWKSLGPSA